MENKAALGIEIADGMQARHELAAVLAERVHRHGAHTSHNAHIGDDVRAVGHLDAHPGMRRAGDAHQVGDDIHCPALHAAVKEFADALFRLGGVHPVVIWPSVFAPGRADIGQPFGAGHIIRIATMQVRVGISLLIHLDERAVTQHLRNQFFIFALRAITPDNTVWPGASRRVFNP